MKNFIEWIKRKQVNPYRWYFESHKRMRNILEKSRELGYAADKKQRRLEASKKVLMPSEIGHDNPQDQGLIP